MNSLAGSTATELGGSASGGTLTAGSSAGDAAGGSAGQSAGGAGGSAERSAGGSAGQSAGGNGDAGTVATGGSSGSGTSGSASCGAQTLLPAYGLPSRAQLLRSLRAANDHFMTTLPDPSADVVTDKARPSNLWTRSVYFEGLMALAAVESDPTRKSRYYDYAVKWAASPNHPWQLAYGGTTTRDADYQCCAQTYLDLNQIQPQAQRIRDTKTDIDHMLSSSQSGDWTWIDAIQMAMPVFAKLGALESDPRYFEKMHALYSNAKITQGLYNATDHLWWRDATFKPPFATPNGRQCYWSRGNGWVFAALTRVLAATPNDEAHHAEYVADFSAMAAALRAAQRADGFWNVSLADPDDHGGPELTGTALFAYGIAFGIQQGLLDASDYASTLSKAWCAMASAVHEDGSLGYAQGSGSQPADGQPVSFDSAPDFNDFPLGCFLLGGSAAWQLAAP